MDRIVKQIKIAAMTMEHFLSHVEDGDLIIVQGDRDDIILASLSTLFSANYQNVAGILLSGGFHPGKNTMRLPQLRHHLPQNFHSISHCQCKDHKISFAKTLLPMVV
jgi:BioD-like phosphotransacetylase family protein